MLKFKRWGVDYHVYIRKESISHVSETKNGGAVIYMIGAEDGIYVVEPLTEVLHRLGY